MKKAIKILAVLIFIVFVGLQFIRPERTNPPVNESDTLQASTEIPKEVNSRLKRSCNDCHSDETTFPWYSNIAPISWSVVDHIRVGRSELNFSIWKTYSKDKKLRKLEEVCEEIQSRNMPHNQYLWIHWEAELSDADIKLICDWTEVEAKKLSDEEIIQN